MGLPFNLCLMNFIWTARASILHKGSSLFNSCFFRRWHECNLLECMTCTRSLFIYGFACFYIKSNNKFLLTQNKFTAFINRAHTLYNKYFAHTKTTFIDFMEGKTMKNHMIASLNLKICVLSPRMRKSFLFILMKY